MLSSAFYLARVRTIAIGYITRPVLGTPLCVVRSCLPTNLVYGRNQPAVVQRRLLSQTSLTISTFERGMLSEHLEATKERYLADVRDGKGGDWTVVMGNEAGDLDSVASSIAYAWYLSNHSISTKDKAIPLIQTPHKDLHLRPENIRAFELSKLHTRESPKQLDEAILCIDDIPVQEMAPFPSSTFAIVDHNKLIPPFSSYPNARVVAVLDHHADEGYYTETANPRIVKATGSAASLVGKYIKDQLKEKHKEVPKEVATLLLCAILVDTGGLKPGGKAIDEDREAAKWLFELAGLAGAATGVTVQTSEATGAIKELHAHSSIQALTYDLAEKKANVGHLSTIDLLRRDYKQYAWNSKLSSSSSVVNVGLSTVPIGLVEWLSPFRLKETPAHGIDKDVAKTATKEQEKKFKEDASQAAEEEFWKGVDVWVEERKLDVFGILTSYKRVGNTKAKKAKKEKESDSDTPSSSSSTSDAKSKPKKAKHRRQIVLIVRAGAPNADALFESLKKGLEESEELNVARKKMKKVFKLRGEGRANGQKETDVDAKEVKDENGVAGEVAQVVLAASADVGGQPKLLIRFYKQGNVKATRKAIAPLVQRIVEGESKPEAKM